MSTAYFCDQALRERKKILERKHIPALNGKESKEYGDIITFLPVSYFSLSKVHKSFLIIAFSNSSSLFDSVIWFALILRLHWKLLFTLVINNQHVTKSKGHFTVKFTFSKKSLFPDFSDSQPLLAFISENNGSFSSQFGSGLWVTLLKVLQDMWRHLWPI